MKPRNLNSTKNLSLINNSNNAYKIAVYIKNKLHLYVILIIKVNDIKYAFSINLNTIHHESKNDISS